MNSFKLSGIAIAAGGVLLVFSQTVISSLSQEAGQEEAKFVDSDDLEGRSGALEVFEPNPDFATIYIVRKKKFRASGVNISPNSGET